MPQQQLQHWSYNHAVLAGVAGAAAFITLTAFTTAQICSRRARHSDEATEGEHGSAVDLQLSRNTNYCGEDVLANACNGGNDDGSTVMKPDPYDAAPRTEYAARVV